MAKKTVNGQEMTVVIDHGHGVKDTTIYGRLGWFLRTRGLLREPQVPPEGSWNGGSWGGGAFLGGDEQDPTMFELNQGNEERGSEVREVCAKCGLPNIPGQGGLTRFPLWGSPYDGMPLCSLCWNDESRAHERSRFHRTI